MALIPCPICGQMISDKALRCPKCGEPMHPQQTSPEEPKKPKNKNGTTIAIIIASVVLFIGLIAVIVAIQEKRYDYDENDDTAIEEPAPELDDMDNSILYEEPDDTPVSISTLESISQEYNSSLPLQVEEGIGISELR